MAFVCSGQVVNVLSHMREQFADRDSALAVLLEFPWAGECVANIVELSLFDLCRKRLTVSLVEFRFRIERIDLRYASIHIQEDHAGDLWIVVRFARRKCRQIARGCGFRFVGKQRGQREGSEAVRCLLQHFSARCGSWSQPLT